MTKKHDIRAKADPSLFRKISTAAKQSHMHIGAFLLKAAEEKLARDTKPSAPEAAA